MEYKILVSPSAKLDMIQIHDYIANELCAPDSADKLLLKFLSAIERLKKFPLSGDNAHLEFLGSDYRKILIDNYFMFYKVNVTDSNAYVLRVLFASSDYIKILNRSFVD